ncbi:glycosyl transferase family 2 [Methanocaldococcus vulcanius M7]|uniref:Glycosyl transferase family 2 n=1 Tax=Methanocaldococcus vulcanius (strain ATCC 700851 / DSM 12094 / M7) TaxID=579137 RepID=C9RGV3_METVM|nr:glycosyltransferase family 2 protein [Methanocaldococcus vulcanius]ACX72805.1 glycosyl transferase family 2 [Methanocaldococcus vulcanius M7]
MIAVIPVFNEEKNILKVLKDLEDLNIDAIVVDDGSEDNTTKLVENFSKNSKINIYLIRNEKNEGKAKAIEKGTKFALSLNKYQYVVYIDGDYQHKPKDIPKLFKKLKEKNADAVFGIRNYKHIPIHRRLSNFLASILTSLAVLIYSKRFYFFKDVQCGFRIIKSEFLKDIKFGEGYAVEHFIALQLAKKGAKIVEEYISVEYHRDAISYITPRKILEVAKHVVKFILLE